MKKRVWPALLALLIFPVSAWALQGTANEITVQDGAVAFANNPIRVNEGGTGAATLTQYAVILGNGTTAVNFAAPGANPQALVSNGAAADPSFQALDLDGTSVVSNTLAVANGGTNLTSLTQYAVILGNAASDPNFASPGVDPQALISNGASANPSFQALNLAGTNSVTGLLPLANGGTNKNISVLNGALLYTDADSVEVMASVGSSGQCLTSQGAGSPPQWTGCGGKALIGFGAGIEISANQLMYVGPGTGMDSDPDRVAVKVNNDTTIDQMACTNSAIQGAGNNIDVTLFEGTCGSLAADTETVCTITGTAGADQGCTDEDPEVVSAGTCFVFEIDTPATLTANAVVSCTAETS